MASILGIKVHESLSEANNSRYVTYTFTSDIGDVLVIGPVLEDQKVDVHAKALKMEPQILSLLADREMRNAYSIACREGVNPANLTYTYNDKATVLMRMYSDMAVPDGIAAASSLSKIENAKNRIKIFLGIV